MEKTILWSLSAQETVVLISPQNCHAYVNKCGWSLVMESGVSIWAGQRVMVALILIWQVLCFGKSNI